MSLEKLNTGQKALQINVDAKKYGTFAEIGAGQEVARWFFQVGKASGTVAKTITFTSGADGSVTLWQNLP